MSTSPQILDHRGNAITVHNISALESAAREASASNEYLVERLAELELAQEDAGWRQLIVGGQREFSRGGLQDIMKISRLMYLKNPLIRRGVNIQSTYVWGRGVEIAGRDPLVNEVVQDFLDDPRNQAELTSHQARSLKEIDLQVLGNLFFVFFTNPATGAVATRTLPCDEVKVIISNPEDSKEPWFYRREWTVTTFDEAGREKTESQVALYPDWGYTPAAKPMNAYGAAVKWDFPVHHVRVGGLSDMVFGVPETYAAIDWARSYKEFLEDWCTITRAYARFAWNMKTVGGNRGVQQAKTKLGTTLASGPGFSSLDNNPSPVTGSTFIRTEGVELEPMKTAGATTSADDGHQIKLMVAAALGIPETFFGDATAGSYATSKTLDRPTELKFLDRQTLWAETLRRILDYVVDRSAAAPSGKLQGKTLVKNIASADETKGDTDKAIPIRSDPKAGEEIDRFVQVSFPALLEHDVLAQVEAIVAGATLSGFTLAGTMDLKTVSRMLLTELGATEIDELLEQLFPDGEEVPSGKPMPDADRVALAKTPPPAPVVAATETDPADKTTAAKTSEAMMASAVGDLRETLRQFASKHAIAA